MQQSLMNSSGITLNLRIIINFRDLEIDKNIRYQQRRRERFEAIK